MGYTITTREKTLTSSANIYILYQCSHCLNQIIKTFSISSQASGAAGLLINSDSEKLQNKAEADLQERIKKLLDYLEAPTEEKLSALKLGKKVIMGSCPFCGGKEPWQKEEQLKGGDQTSQVKIHHNLFAAFEEARLALRERRQDVLEIQADEQREAAARDVYEQLNLKLQSLENEIENGETAAKLKKLQNNETILEKKISELGMFSKEKKALKEQLQECVKAIPDATKAFEEEKKRLDDEIANLQPALTKASIPVKKYMEKAILIENATTVGLALCEEGHQPEGSGLISLRSLSNIGDFVISDFEPTDSEQVQSMIQELAKEEL